MATSKSSHVYLYKDCPLKYGDMRTWSFSQKSLRNNYAVTGSQLWGTRVKVITDSSYVPTESGRTHIYRVCTDTVVTEDFLNVNYMMFLNDSFSDFMYFAFVLTAKYINDITVEYTYIIDDLQTYMFEFSISQAMVERMHIAHDNYFASTTAEPDIPANNSSHGFTRVLENIRWVNTDDPADAHPGYIFICERSVFANTELISDIYKKFDTLNNPYIRIYGSPIEGPSGLVAGAHQSISGIPITFAIFFAQAVANDEHGNSRGARHLLELFELNNLTARIYSIQLLPNDAFDNLPTGTSINGFCNIIETPNGAFSAAFSNGTDFAINAGMREISTDFQFNPMSSLATTVCNAKCFNYPFTKLILNCNGAPSDLKPEKILKPITDSNINFSARFLKVFQYFPTPLATVWLYKYEREDNDYVSTPAYVPDNFIEISPSQSLSFTVDSYGEYLTTSYNANAQIFAAKKSAAAYELAGSLINGVASASSKAMAGNYGGAAVSAIASGGSSMLNYISTTNTINAQMRAAEAQARDAVDRVVNGTQGSLPALYANDALMLSCLSSDILKIVDDYFSLFGYAVNTTLTNITFRNYRPLYNFFMASQITFKPTSSVPISNSALQSISRRFEEGVLFVGANQTTTVDLIQAPLDFASRNSTIPIS